MTIAQVLVRISRFGIDGVKIFSEKRNIFSFIPISETAQNSRENFLGRI